MSFSDLYSDVVQLVFAEVHPCYYIDLAQVCKDWSKTILHQDFIYSMYSKWIYGSQVKELKVNLPGLTYEHLSLDAALMWPVEVSKLQYDCITLCLHAIKRGYSEEECMKYLEFEVYDSVIAIEVAIHAWKRNYKNLLTCMNRDAGAMIIRLTAGVLLTDLGVEIVLNTLTPILYDKLGTIVRILETDIKWECIEDYANVMISFAKAHSDTYVYDLCNGIYTSAYNISDFYVEAGYLIGKHMEKSKLHTFIDKHCLLIDKDELPTERVNTRVLGLDVQLWKKPNFELICDEKHNKRCISLMKEFRPDLYDKVCLIGSGYEVCYQRHNPYYLRKSQLSDN